MNDGFIRTRGNIIIGGTYVPCNSTDATQDSNCLPLFQTGNCTDGSFSFLGNNATWCVTNREAAFISVENTIRWNDNCTILIL